LSSNHPLCGFCLCRFLPAYNSLTDKHLADYFSNSRIRKHLLKAGLITRSGRIVPEKDYKHKLIQTANQNNVRECLAQAIFQKVLEREHYYQIEIKRKQADYERKQRVQRFKVRHLHLNSCPPSVPRPNTAPGKMQRPVRLKPIQRRSYTALPRHISPYRKSTSFLESQPFNLASCYHHLLRLPRLLTQRITKNFIIPVPPETPPKVTPSSTIRSRRLRPSTSSSGVEVSAFLRVTMVYFGKLVHLSDHPSILRDEIKVLQQHCGGENLCVYQGKLCEGDVFQFLSRRHKGFSFSLTFYQNGLLVERLSSCCEYKHSKGSRIGGRHGLFGFCSMEGASPCYKLHLIEYPKWLFLFSEHLKTLVEETSCEENVTNEVVEEQKVFTEAEEEEDKISDHGDNTQEERVGEVGEDGKPTEDEARTQRDKSEEPGEPHLPVDGEVAQDDKIEDPFERSDVEATHNNEEKVEKGSAKPDSQHDESGQRAKSREEDESSVLEPSEEADEPAVPDIAEAEATSETMETKAESSEEQEALSCEEAPETGTDEMQADSEEAQVTVENLSRSPEECGDSTTEKTVEMHVEAVKTRSINDKIHVETKQQLSRTEEGEDDSREENCGVRDESVEEHETAERQNLTHLEEITEAENKAEEINDESKVDESNEQTKNPPEGTECEEIQDEENKDKIRETEKDGNEEDEGKISWGEPEATTDDKGQASEKGSETKKGLREKDDEAGMLDNGEKEKVEGNKTNEEYEDITKNSVAEERETSEITEVPQKSQDTDLDTEKMKTSSEMIAESEKVSESKAAEGTEMHQPTLAVAESETGEREAEKESERGEIDAKNGESSFATEREPQEDEENAVTSDEKRQTDEPDEEIESTEVKEVVMESGDNAEKQDSLTDQTPETGVPESDAKETDGSMVKHDEAASRVSEPETFGAEIQEERNANEDVDEVENENKVCNLILNNAESDIGEVSPLGEISSAADVEETAKQKDEGTSRSITDKALETGENGEDTEEASKASEEGASVLRKPLAPNTEGEDVVSEGTPEALSRDDNTDMVTNWIQMHQTSKFFETFVEPLEDLRNEVPDAQVSNPNGEEKESAELLRPESPTKMGRISEDGDIEDSRKETQAKAIEGGLQGSEEAGKKSPETSKEPDQHDSRGSQGDDQVSQEGNIPFTTEVETFSSSLKAKSDFENQSGGNANSGPGLIVIQTATDPSFKPEQSNSLNGQGDTDNTLNNISRDGHQITKLTTSHSADGSRQESCDEDVQTKMLERRFSGETRDTQIIEDIKHTLSKERLSTFSLFGHTSYPD
uniref:DUF4590 domain-containing protein n=1 Tax=Xiphophorus couchianus TaxID=32473 RepID=A0A3B5LZF4_9TELE